MSFLINPYAFLAGGDFESIATVTLGSDTASVTFSDLGAYQHLQLHVLARSTRTGATGDYLVLRLNSDTGSNYAWHTLEGNGASTSATAGTSQTGMYLNRLGDSSNADYWGAMIINVLDFGSTTKTKTIRSFGGNDRNGAGIVSLDSGLWNSTAAATSVTATLEGGRSFKTNSTFALYGLKAPA